MHRKLAVAIACAVIGAPIVAWAFPFGGAINVIKPCYNNAIYVSLGPPRGGPYIWTPATRTYQFGPPRSTGQWLLGLASAPYYCVISIFPVIVWPGTHIDMMGSSGPAAPRYTPPQPSYSQGGYYSQGAYGTPPGPTTIGHLVISEVFYNVDSEHGSDPQHEWVELYNGTNAALDISSWTLMDSSGSDTIPQGIVIPSGSYVIIAATSSISSYWSIPQGVRVVSLNSVIGDGLANGGDMLRIRNTAGVAVDAVSWGNTTAIFNPSVPGVATGHSMSRKNLSSDTDSASDWKDLTPPGPGKI